VADAIIHDIQMTRKINYAGALAGYDLGPTQQGDATVLVTSAPIILNARHEDRWDVWQFIERLLGDEAIWVHAWLKLAREALLAHSLRRGQALVIVGPRDHGKSVLIKLIAAMLGGRVANPWQYLRGETSFNEDLFGAELLAIDDQGSDDDWRGRKRMGDAIKQFAGDAFPRCHAKGSKAVTLFPFWRMIITLNDEAEDIQVLPPLTHGIEDKLIILRTVERAVTMPTSRSEDYVRFMRQLHAAIPTYLAWLAEWRLPTDLEADRFGMGSYHTPEVAQVLQEFSPESRLLILIDQCYEWGERTTEVLGTAREIEQRLKESEVERDVRELLRGPGAIGKLLARLCRTEAERVSSPGRRSGGGSRIYMIKPCKTTT
jgi:hypothetical protein